MTSDSRRTLAWLVAAALAAPAGADWLVTRDGDKIETKGPWKVDGRRVLFTQPNGTLSSVRTDDVDLDRSSIETARARELATTPPAPEPKREPVLRLTEKDLPPVRDLDEPESATAAKPGDATASGLEVISWEKTDMQVGDGIEIFGTLRNSGTATITSPTMLVMLYDEDGGLLATNEGTINAGVLQVGRSANFRVAFPGIPDFAAVKFDVQGRGFRTRGAEPEEGAEPAEPIGMDEEEEGADAEPEADSAAPPPGS